MDRQLRQQLSMYDFLDINPTGEPANIEDPKASFLAKIGLDETLYDHNMIFRTMLVRQNHDETIDGSCTDLFKEEAENHLIAATRCDSALRQVLNGLGRRDLRPVLHTSIALRQVKERIYLSSPTHMKTLYDLLRNRHTECWAIDWALWQAMMHYAGYPYERVLKIRDERELDAGPRLRAPLPVNGSQVEALQEQVRTQQGGEETAEARASRTLAKAMGEDEKDSLSPAVSPTRPKPMSVQQLLNPQDDES